MSSIRLEVGKTYRTEQGHKAFCIAELVGDQYACLVYYDDLAGKYKLAARWGSVGNSLSYGHSDIISEWIDLPQQTAI